MSNHSFTIVIDSREQLPFDFAQFGIETVHLKLDAGDYGIVGLPGIVVERKAPGDLLSVMGVGRERFTRELERLQALDFSAVVCEAPITALLSGEHSRMNPASVVATLLAWQQRFPRTHWWLCPSRTFAEKLTYKLLERFWRDTNEGKRASA